MAMQAQEIEIKGIKNGILIEVKEGDWSTQQDAVLSHIDQNLTFFESAKLVIDVGERVLKSPELARVPTLTKTRC